MIFLIIYASFNILALLLMGTAIYWDEVSLFIYPTIFEKLDEYGINLAGKISMSTILTIMFAPAMIFHFAILGISTGIVFLGSWGFKLFCKIFKKKVD